MPSSKQTPSTPRTTGTTTFVIAEATTPSAQAPRTFVTQRTSAEPPVCPLTAGFALPLDPVAFGLVRPLAPSCSKEHKKQ